MSSVDAFAAQFIQRRNTHPADRPLGVFLLAGPDPVGTRRDRMTRLPSAAHVKAGRGNLFAEPPGADEDALLQPARASRQTPPAPSTISTRPTREASPILDNIDKAHPGIMLPACRQAWSTGRPAQRPEGEAISIAGATFLLTTELASDAIDRADARRESDPDRLHIEGLKILLDAGFPASLLTRHRPGCLSTRRHASTITLRSAFIAGSS